MKSKARNVRRTRNYTESFKRLVVEEYLEGDLTIKELMSKYDILGGSCISHWRRDLGYPDPTISFDAKQYDLMASKKKAPKTSPSAQRSMKELQKQLDDAKLHILLLERIIDVSEKELGIKIKKK